MSRYGQVVDYKMDSAEFRVKSFIQEMRSIDFGNCGVPTKLQDYLIRDQKAIEDIFTVGASLYILPRSRETAKFLFDVVMDEYDESRDDCGFPLADDVTWAKLGDRYWLHLWWD